MHVFWTFQFPLFFCFCTKTHHGFVQLQIVMGIVCECVGCRCSYGWNKETATANRQLHEWMLDIGYISHFKCENAFTLTIEHWTRICHFLLKRLWNLFNLNYNFVLNDSWPFTTECGGRKRKKKVLFLNSVEMKMKIKWSLIKTDQKEKKPKEKDRPFLKITEKLNIRLNGKWYLLLL